MKQCSRLTGRIIFTFISLILPLPLHQRETLQETIHVRGCIHAVNLWMSDNIGITAALCCAIGLPQVTTTHSRLRGRD